MIVNLPTPQDLAPWFQQLEAHPGSVVLIAVSNQSLQLRKMHSRLAVTEERKALKTALEKARKRRALSRQEARGDLGTVSETNEAQ